MWWQQLVTTRIYLDKSWSPIQHLSKLILSIYPIWRWLWKLLKQLWANPLDAVLATNFFLIVTIGDFDAKSSNCCTGDTTTFEGSKIETITSQFGPQQIINKPTHIQLKSVSCIDLIFPSQPNFVMYLLNSVSQSTIHHLTNHLIM